MKWIFGILFVLSLIAAPVSSVVLQMMKNSGIGEVRNIPLIVPAIFFGFFAAIFFALFILTIFIGRKRKNELKK